MTSDFEKEQIDVFANWLREEQAANAGEYIADLDSYRGDAKELYHASALPLMEEAIQDLEILDALLDGGTRPPEKKPLAVKAMVQGILKQLKQARGE